MIKSKDYQQSFRSGILNRFDKTINRLDYYISTVHYNLHKNFTFENGTKFGAVLGSGIAVYLTVRYLTDQTFRENGLENLIKVVLLSIGGLSVAFGSLGYMDQKLRRLLKLNECEENRIREISEEWEKIRIRRN